MPSQAKKIALDTVALFGAKTINLLLAIVRLKYIAVYLGVGTFGIYTFATYFVAMFSIFFDLGISQILTRDIASDKSRTSQYIADALLLKILLFFSTAIMIVGATYFSHFDGITNWAVVFSIVITGTTSLTTVFTGAFQAHRKMKLISIITVATDLLTSVAVILSLVLGFGLFGLMLGSATVSLIMLALTFFISRRLLGISIVAPVKKLWSYLLKEGFPIAIGSLGITLYLYVTSALLKYIDGNVAAGYYNAAFKFISILTVIPVSFTLVVFPFFAELHATDKNKLGSVLNTSVRYMFIISIPMAVGTIMIARNLVATVYTLEFLPSVPVLQILIVSSMISYGNYVLYIFFPTVNRQRFGMFVTIPTGVVVAIVNYILIPKYGILVPALSLVAVEIVLFTAANIYLDRIGFPLHLKKIFPKPLFACVPMAISIYLLSNTSIFLQIVIAAIVYAVSFYFLKGILAEDKPILEKILPSPLKEFVLK